MNPIFTITLEGKCAKGIAAQVITSSGGAAKERTLEVPSHNHRAIDFLAIVDFFKLIAPIATTIGGIAGTLNFIIQRIQALRKKETSPVEITFIIYIENTTQEFPIYEDLSEEAQEKLVEKAKELLKPLE